MSTEGGAADAHSGPVRSDYETSLFACCEDIESCCCGCFCSPCISAFNGARVDGRECTPFDCCCTSPYQVRQTFRHKYNLGFEEIMDVLLFTFCFPCSIVQDAKEIAIKRGDESVYFDKEQIKSNLMGDRD
eukprot:295277_1